MNYKNYYKTKDCETQNSSIQQLLQLLRIVWDGDLMSKQERDVLVAQGMAQRADGFNFITPQGIKYLLELKLIRP